MESGPKMLTSWKENYFTHKTTVDTSEPVSTFAKNGPTISQNILPTIITIWVTCFLALLNAFHV
jgi:hypothetical protein